MVMFAYAFFWLLPVSIAGVVAISIAPASIGRWPTISALGMNCLATAWLWLMGFVTNEMSSVVQVFVAGLPSVALFALWMRFRPLDSASPRT